MISELALRWIVTVAFSAVGLFCLYRCARESTATHRIDDVLHALMCVAMVAMAWPAAMNVARIPQILLFGAAALWFVGTLAVGRPGHDRLALGYHAVLMAAMAWMVLVMPSAMSGATTAETPQGGEHAGMSMGGGAMTTNAPPHVSTVAIGLTVVFVVAGVFWLARAIDTGRAPGSPRLPAIGLAVDAAMGLGMALMTGLLI